MGKQLSLDDRIHAIQQHCADNHIELGMEFDPVDNTWTGWEGDEDLTGPCDSFETLIQALEADFSID